MYLLLIFQLLQLLNRIRMEELRKLYLDIVRKTILGTTYRDPSLNASNGTQIQYNQESRENGEDWPILAHSMAGNKRLLNIQALAEQVFANNIPGDFVETGIWRGGSCIFMSAIFKAYGITDRQIYACDSFEGLPKPDESYPADKNDTHYLAPFLSVSLEQVKENFEGYDLLTDQVHLVKGWFSNTLPTLPVNKVAILRLDGDMYESTINALENLYSKLSVGGYVIVDDYGLANCREALTDYRKYFNITDEYVRIDNSSVYWQKTSELPHLPTPVFKQAVTTPEPPAPTMQYAKSNITSISSID